MASKSRLDEDRNIFRIPPYYYLHVLDQNSNVTRVVEGPLTFIRQDNEKVVFGPEKMVTVPPRNYCIVENPVLRDKDGKVVYDELIVSSGKEVVRQVKLRHAEQEIRLARDPFPLFPGEVLKKDVTSLTVVPADTALRLKAILDFKDGDELAQLAVSGCSRVPVPTSPKLKCLWRRQFARRSSSQIRLFEYVLAKRHWTVKATSVLRVKNGSLCVWVPTSLAHTRKSWTQ